MCDSVLHCVACVFCVILRSQTHWCSERRFEPYVDEKYKQHLKDKDKLDAVCWSWTFLFIR